jgi:sugar phosphate permease
MPDTEQARPSYGRWHILGLLCLMYLITYLDRVNIATAAPEIRKEFGFDQATMGVIFSAFVWGYAVFQVSGGWLSDRFGVRFVLTGIVLYWSLMTAGTALATGLASFFVLRFLFGVGEAGAFPGATRAMQLWYPSPERGFVQGFTHSASRLGAAIAPPIVVLIMFGGQLDWAWLPFSISLPALGWRSVFYICGAAGSVWSIWWVLTYRNLPEEHGAVNRAELEHIRGTNAQGDIKPPPATRQAVPLGAAIAPPVLLIAMGLAWIFGGPYVFFPIAAALIGGTWWYLWHFDPTWGRLLRSPNMWAIMCAYFTYVYCLYIFLTWLPSYLVDARGFTLLKVGLLASLPLWGGVIGDTVGGIATDWLVKRTGSARIGRRAVAITGLLGCAAFIVPAALTADPYIAVYCLTASMFFLECTIGPAWAVPMDCGGEYSGTVSGMMNMAGNIGGALSPIVFGALAQGGNWQAPFILAAALLVAGAGVWAFWLDPEQSVVERTDTKTEPAVAAAATAV